MESLNISLGNITKSKLDPQDSLFKAAQGFERGFISEFLQLSQRESSDSFFSGGIGEEQFQSFLKDAQAMEITRTGTFGIAETIVRAFDNRGREDIHGNRR